MPTPASGRGLLYPPEGLSVWQGCSHRKGHGCRCMQPRLLIWQTQSFLVPCREALCPGITLGEPVAWNASISLSIFVLFLTVHIWWSRSVSRMEFFSYEARILGRKDLSMSQPLQLLPGHPSFPTEPFTGGLRIQTSTYPLLTDQPVPQGPGC